jgi:hypothetical protein
VLCLVVVILASRSFLFLHRRCRGDFHGPLSHLGSDARSPSLQLLGRDMMFTSTVIHTKQARNLNDLTALIPLHVSDGNLIALTGHSPVQSSQVEWSTGMKCATAAYPK